MAETKDQFEQPKGTSVPVAPAPVIHVMPEEFRFGKTPMTAPVKPPAPVVVSPVAPPTPPPAPKPPVPASGLPAKKRRLPPVVLFGGGFFLFIALGAGIILWTLREPTPVVPVVPTNQVTTNTTNTSKPEPVVVPVEPAPVEDVSPTGGADADSDGLTDIEEILFGSNSRNPDSDSDTYLDGNEVYHLYNPRGDAPGLLIDTGFARLFRTEGLDFQVTYPSRWIVQLLSAPQEGVVFKVPTGEFVQVSKEQKDPALDIASWYLTQDPTAEASQITPLTTRNGYSGVLSPDSMTAYLNNDDAVYVISYHLGSVKAINFLTTYQMMVNSFDLNN